MIVTSTIAVRRTRCAPSSTVTDAADVSGELIDDHETRMHNLMAHPVSAIAYARACAAAPRWPPDFSEADSQWRAEAR
jgi:hypothetical protein